MKLALVVVLLLCVAMIDLAKAGESESCEKSIKKKNRMRSKICEQEEKIQQLADQLSEIQALLEEEEEPEGADPTVVQGDASQSSTGWGGLAVRAIDRNENTNYFGHSCTHTQKELSPWWKVVYRQPVKVTKVKLVNRSDCCSDRLHDVQVTVDGTVCFVHSGAIGASLEQECANYIVGTEVMVTLQGQNEYLTLCEVVVS